MRIDKTTASLPQQDFSEESNIPTGVYTCRLTEVKEIAPKQDDERQTPRLVFEYEVVEGKYRGKKLASIVRKNLFAGGGPKNAQPSHLYKLARSLGAADPMNFDTDSFIGRTYTVVAENNDGKRAWPTNVLPAAQPDETPAGNDPF